MECRLDEGGNKAIRDLSRKKGTKYHDAAPKIVVVGEE